jgi:hypothetical protein
VPTSSNSQTTKSDRCAEQNRALRMLAASPNGATEAIMLAHGSPSRPWAA